MDRAQAFQAVHDHGEVRLLLAGAVKRREQLSRGWLGKGASRAP
jgi:hypothetical protein